MKRLSILLFILLHTPLYSMSVSEPFVYPEDGSTIENPPIFVWEDIYFEKKNSERLNITIKNSKSGVSKTSPFSPELLNSKTLFFETEPLTSGKYEWSIDSEKEDSSRKSDRFYTFRRYPISGNFTVGSNRTNLSAVRRADILFSTQNNKVENGYNSLFYLGGSAGSFGIGVLCYKFIPYKLISRIAAYTCFISSGAGLGASGYYGAKYLNESNRIERLKENKETKEGVTLNQSMINDESYVYATYHF